MLRCLEQGLMRKIKTQVWIRQMLMTSCWWQFEDICVSNFLCMLLIFQYVCYWLFNICHQHQLPIRRILICHFSFARYCSRCLNVAVTNHINILDSSEIFIQYNTLCNMIYIKIWRQMQYGKIPVYVRGLNRLKKTMLLLQ